METKKCNKCGKVKPLPEIEMRKRGSLNTWLIVNPVKRNIKKSTRWKKREAPKSRVCKCCKQEKPIDSFYKKYPNRDGNWVYYWTCKACKREAYREKHGVKRVPKPPKPSVWDLTCMPKGLSVEDTVQLAEEAFPLLSNQYWKAGEAQKIYKQFGMKWSYL